MAPITPRFGHIQIVPGFLSPGFGVRDLSATCRGATIWPRQSMAFVNVIHPTTRQRRRRAEWRIDMLSILGRIPRISPGVAALAATLLVALSACGSSSPPPAPPQTSAVIVVPSELSAPQPETVPPPPGVSAAWEPGHWSWTGVTWAWEPSHYVEPPRTTMQWVAGRWLEQGSGWVWIPGRWM